MGIVQVFLDPSGDWIITGHVEFDSASGAHLKLPQGTSFPADPEAGDFFFRTDELKLYRHSGSAWQEQVVSVGPHRLTHEPGGSDALTVDAAVGTGSLRTLGTGAQQACSGSDLRLSDARTPTAHATSHENGGVDEISVAGLSGTLADPQTPSTHATTHQSGGADSIKLDDFAAPDDNTDLDSTTSRHGLLPKLGGGAVDFLRADGLWATPPGGGGGGNLVKMLQIVDIIGGMKITTSAQPIEFTYENIKDDYYAHSTTVDPEVVEILQDGWYRITAELTVHTVSASGGIRGNPRLHIDIDTGSGWVQQPDNMGGYIREDGSNNLACSITGVGFFEFSAGDKIRITVFDTVPNPPDEETVPYSSRLLLEYIDRTGSASGTVENLKDIGDVDAPAPNDGDVLVFNATTSKWESGAGGGGGPRTFHAEIKADGSLATGAFYRRPPGTSPSGSWSGWPSADPYVIPFDCKLVRALVAAESGAFDWLSSPGPLLSGLQLQGHTYSSSSTVAVFSLELAGSFTGGNFYTGLHWIVDGTSLTLVSGVNLFSRGSIIGMVHGGLSASPGRIYNWTNPLLSLEFEEV